jgi:hypothetical protein
MSTLELNSMGLQEVSPNDQRKIEGGLAEFSWIILYLLKKGAVL